MFPSATSCEDLRVPVDSGTSQSTAQGLDAAKAARDDGETHESSVHIRGDAEPGCLAKSPRASRKRRDRTSAGAQNKIRTSGFPIAFSVEHAFVASGEGMIRLLSSLCQGAGLHRSALSVKAVDPLLGMWQSNAARESPCLKNSTSEGHRTTRLKSVSGRD
jgi:hypothetical protein